MAGDLVEIRRLVDSYAVAMDSADLGAFPRLFVPGGRLLILAPGREQPLAVFEGPGPDGIGVIATLMQGIYEATLHHVTSHVATVAGDSAEGTTYCLAQHVLAGADGEVLEQLCVRYAESFTRTAAGWRFESRAATRIWATSTPAPRLALEIDRAAARARGG